jgi:Uma2 family endonuclease
MSALPKPNMTADEFLEWVAAQPKEAGRFELIDGTVVKMQAEWLVHAEVKLAMAVLLREAISQAKVPCFAVPDGSLVRTSSNKTYQPDALVYCGARHAADVIEVPNPVILCEVLSPDSVDRDFGEKVQGYFSLPSVRHYLIVDAARRVVIHHRRGDGEDLITRFRKSGELRLDPPGISMKVDQLFERDAL